MKVLKVWKTIALFRAVLKQIEVIWASDEVIEESKKIETAIIG